MRRTLAAVATRTAMAVRGLWPDRNPLRRGVDRAEAAIVGGLAVAFLAGAPLAAIAAGHLAYAAASRAAAAERSSHQVHAVLLASPTMAEDGEYGATAPARWAGPGGTQRTGTLWVPAGAQARSIVTVWVDAAGQLTSPPLQPSEVRGQAVAATVLAPMTLGLLLVGAGLLASEALWRRREAAWDADWQATAPRWTRHYR
jgi:hypothetical protein